MFVDYESYLVRKETRICKDLKAKRCSLKYNRPPDLEGEVKV
jgi:hypothetical protein